ncbi:hypothetical protein A3A95_04460 [Candidatus Nomurabacteria bacterium RIFCSPLOWO2_01_FULL_39_18]|uniref:Uncharacterized protein n=1 Tax=Candidatus Nomurabacteria bacterium RIFCSPHIGHO2_01_FULL_40_24b TaxID=1801739 RepID=A0A1F6V630_9BACT|nr:MAG: hypothetical protein A2647_04065 [Candidatus Nomurabacteria bacterium RIFCSPHIGHO2_01_FULL_40_24b]OGI89349.1 MAG: hypothetical protein A3A95_04460 [Candidatus Nomurabacteria bacterium RIFCSPLOWO2_01_FULL_39_18]
MDRRTFLREITGDVVKVAGVAIGAKVLEGVAPGQARKDISEELKDIEPYIKEQLDEIEKRRVETVNLIKKEEIFFEEYLKATEDTKKRAIMASMKGGAVLIKINLDNLEKFSEREVKLVGMDIENNFKNRGQPMGERELAKIDSPMATVAMHRKADEALSEIKQKLEPGRAKMKKMGIDFTNVSTEMKGQPRAPGKGLLDKL